MKTATKTGENKMATSKRSRSSTGANKVRPPKRKKCPAPNLEECREDYNEAQHDFGELLYHAEFRADPDGLEEAIDLRIGYALDSAERAHQNLKRLIEETDDQRFAEVVDCLQEQIRDLEGADSSCDLTERPWAPFPSDPNAPKPRKPADLYTILTSVSRRLKAEGLSAPIVLVLVGANRGAAMVKFKRHDGRLEPSFRVINGQPTLPMYGTAMAPEGGRTVFIERRVVRLAPLPAAGDVQSSGLLI